VTTVEPSVRMDHTATTGSVRCRSQSGWTSPSHAATTMPMASISGGVQGQDLRLPDAECHDQIVSALL